MQEDTRPQINASKIVVGGGIAGAVFAIFSMLIFLTGLPVLRLMFPAAILLGLGFALVRRFARRKTPGAPWLLSAIAEAPSKQDHKENPGRSTRIMLDRPAAC